MILYECYYNKDGMKFRYYEVHHENKILHVNHHVNMFSSISNIYDFVIGSDFSHYEFIDMMNNENNKIKILEFEHIEDLIDLVPEEFI